MLGILGFVVFRGRVRKYEPFSLFSNGGEIELQLADGSLMLGKILPPETSEGERRGERNLFRNFLEWGA
jgi:hypothetical protein